MCIRDRPDAVWPANNAPRQRVQIALGRAQRRFIVAKGRQPRIYADEHGSLGSFPEWQIYSLSLLSKLTEGRLGAAENAGHNHPLRPSRKAGWPLENRFPCWLLSRLRLLKLPIWP